MGGRALQKTGREDRGGKKNLGGVKKKVYNRLKDLKTDEGDIREQEK
jgi:hypothetical protein